MHKSKLTKEVVVQDLKAFGKVADVVLHPKGKKALVTFAYNDSVFRAISGSGSIAGCTIRRATENDVQKFKIAEEKKEPDAIKRLKERFAVSGLYKGGFHGETIEDLERSIREVCSQRIHQ
jgi:hypothetical protein